MLFSVNFPKNFDIRQLENATLTMMDEKIGVAGLLGKMSWYQVDNVYETPSYRFSHLILSIVSLATLIFKKLASIQDNEFSFCKSHLRQFYYGKPELSFLASNYGPTIQNKMLCEIFWQLFRHSSELSVFATPIPTLHSEFKNILELLQSIKNVGDPHFNTHNLWFEGSSGNPKDLQKIHINFQNLNEISAYFFTCTNLHYLNLSWNNISSIDNIYKLINLVRLSFIGNKLNRIPENIKELTKLEELYLSYNNFNELPQELSHIVNLKVLDISYNTINFISDHSWDTLRNLVTLNLSSNLFSEIPHELNKIVNLRELNLSRNVINSISDSCWGNKLINLEKLNLSFNRFSEIPRELNQIESLKILKLAYNAIESISDPSWGNNLINLEKLDLSGNKFVEVPLQLFNLPQTCTIDLSGNPLSEGAINALRATANAPDYAGPTFNYNMSQSNILNPRTFGEFLDKRYGKNALSQCLNLSEKKQNDLCNWMSRMEESTDYSQNKEVTKDRIKEILLWLMESEDKDSVELAFTSLEGAARTCGDGASLVYNTIIIWMRLDKEQDMPESHLKELLIGLKRYQLVMSIVEAKIKSLGAVDAAEVELAYLTKLRDPLKLPITSHTMLFERISETSLEEIEEAKNTVLALTSEDSQNEILCSSPIWQKKLKAHSAFAELEKKCKEIKDAWMEENSMNSAALSTFEAKETTDWNPYYQLTLELAKAN